jgi:predicted membrane protein
MAKEIKKVQKEIAENLDNQKVMLFGKQNFIILLVGIALLALGFILMLGGGSNDPDVFNEKMFDFQRITLSTILVLAGFVVEIVAIFWKGKNK